MTANLFKITPTPPTTLTVAPGQEAKFSFTVESLAAPDNAQEVILQALLVGDDGKGKEVNWLVVGPQRAMTIPGGKTVTITITAHPTAASPRGENRLKLVVADKIQPNDLFTESPLVTCEVNAPAVEPKPGSKRPSWLLPAIIAGGVVVVGGIIALVVKLSVGKPPPPPSDAAAADTAPAIDAAPVIDAPPACGHRGQPCCAGSCALRASCDGTACIAADVWASGSDGLANWNGGTWTHPVLGGGILPPVNGLWGTTASFVVGVGNGGLIMRRDSTGWHRDVAPVADLTRNLFAVGGSGATDVWAVGNGAFRHYDGTSWIDVPSPQPPGFDLGYLAVWLSGPGEGWATGEFGILARLHGGTWSYVSKRSNGLDQRGLWGSGPGNIWVVGTAHTSSHGDAASIAHYDGNAWTYGLVDAQSGLLPLTAVWGTDATHVWAVGGHGTVLFWDGSLWRPVTAGTADDLSAIWGSGPSDLWLAGTSGVRHFNGSTWSAVPGMTSPPIALWLSRE